LGDASPGEQRSWNLRDPWAGIAAQSETAQDAPERSPRFYGRRLLSAAATATGVLGAVGLFSIRYSSSNIDIIHRLISLHFEKYDLPIFFGNITGNRDIHFPESPLSIAAFGA
jgi:hypothetical protein